LIIQVKLKRSTSAQQRDLMICCQHAHALLELLRCWLITCHHKGLVLSLFLDLYALNLAALCQR
jgi:hypothetical protein